ncbi:phage integrase SAM-like domain-containing protein [Phreatobacter oligotrophus]|uniref:Site-specific recombinase XerD n=1 Tax=Phreatobacter oligotrophus TaxID=1122261 RepID=A0A2T4Y6N2_9HYPH|nr:phage integrase SAM-like domain-containing protein [Phreatobacter oligotrophus]PTM38223.1 site-specific recombinase XerD [Phreatobacter oligotrophus]
MPSSMNDMVVSVDAEGRIKVRIPLPDDVLSRYRGSTITVPFRLFEFTIQLDDEVTVPLASHSFVEAEKIANAVAASIMQAVTGWETVGAQPIVVRKAGLGLTGGSRAAAEETCAAPGEPDPHPSPSLMDLFEAWAAHHLRAGGAPTTPPYWRLLVSRFAAFVGQVPPAAITSQHLRDYRDHLLASGRKLRTARHADFAALRALFHYAVENGHVPANPVTGVKFRVDRLAVGRGMLAFNADEARQILAAADRETVPAFRWIPWLTALTGSRVATIANLRARDVQNVEGIWCLRITREAGPIKTAASERLVPIHPAILQRGFLAFVRDCGRERLFVEGRRRGADPAATSPYNPARSTLRRLTQWLHDLELEIGREHRKDPNHAWRHWFKEQAFIAGIPEKIADAIVGHAHANASRRYGAVSLEVMARNLEKIRPPM